MNHPDSFPPPFRLCQWLVQPDLNRITGPDGPVRIEPRVMAVLLALAVRPNTVVSRLVLLEEVWGDAVVGEEILTRAISELRRVFGDNARQPEYIETIPHNGYRLIAPLTKPEPEPETTGAGPSSRPASAVPQSSGGSWIRLLVVVVAMAGLLATGLWLFKGGIAQPEVEIALAAQPLTTYPGREWHPALAPAGTRVAFAWSGSEQGGTSIYVKQRNSEKALRLTTEAGWAAWPAWSPDGQVVAFVQTDAGASAIGLVPGLGGAVRWVHRVAGLVEGLDWSPDGAQLAFSARDSTSGRYRLYLCTLADLQVAPLPATRADDAGDFQPRFGPQGKRLAWLGADGTGGSGLFVASVEGGEARTVIATLAKLQGLAWSADGRDLVYSAATDGIYRLWQMPVSGGDPRPLAASGEFAWNPTIARGTGDLAYEQVRVDQDLWRIAVAKQPAGAVDAQPFLTSTRWESSPDFSPDGTAIAFVSSRSGQPEIWLGDVQGMNLRKLTALGVSAVSNLLWSPDGDKLACNAVLAGSSRILVVDAASGVTNELSLGLARESFVAWGSTGAGVLIAARSAQSVWQVYRQSLTGGTAVQITRQGGLTAQETIDGRTLYFTRPDRQGLWRRRTGGRIAPELILPDLLPRDRFNWRLEPERIVWVLRAGSAAFLMGYKLPSGPEELLAELPGLQDSGLAVLPGQDVFVYPRWGEVAGDLMFVAGGGAGNALVGQP